MNEEIKEKYCPLLSTMGNEITGKCMKDECAWWDNNKCAIYSLGIVFSLALKHGWRNNLKYGWRNNLFD